MLRKTNSTPGLIGLRGLLGEDAWASDGRMGVVSDVLVDQREWRVCFLVITSGRRSSDRRVLFPAQSVTARHSGILRMACLHAAMETAPQAPAAGRSLSGLCSAAGALRSAAHAKDGPVGWLTDILVDAGSWQVREIVCDASASSGGHVVLHPSDVETLAGERGVLFRLGRGQFPRSDVPAASRSELVTA